MPNAGAIRAGRAFVELFTDDRKLVRGLKRASRRLKAFAAGVLPLVRHRPVAWSDNEDSLCRVAWFAARSQKKW